MLKTINEMTEQKIATLVLQIVYRRNLAYIFVDTQRRLLTKTVRMLKIVGLVGRYGNGWKKLSSS